jgi:hypothetical protein
MVDKSQKKGSSRSSNAMLDLSFLTFRELADATGQRASGFSGYRVNN